MAAERTPEQTPAEEELRAHVASFLRIADRALASATSELLDSTPNLSVSGALSGSAHLRLMRAVRTKQIPARGEFQLDGRSQGYWLHGAGFTLVVDGIPLAFDLDLVTGEPDPKLMSPWKLSQFIAAASPRSRFANEAECAAGLSALAETGWLRRKRTGAEQYWRPNP